MGACANSLRLAHKEKRVRACAHVCMCKCVCVCMCMCACIWACTCICVNVSESVYAYLCIFVSVCRCVCVTMSMCLYGCESVTVCLCLWLRVCVCVRGLCLCGSLSLLARSDGDAHSLEPRRCVWQPFNSGPCTNQNTTWARLKPSIYAPSELTHREIVLTARQQTLLQNMRNRVDPPRIENDPRHLDPDLLPTNSPTRASTPSGTSVL